MAWEPRERRSDSSRQGDRVRMITTKSGLDHTEAMEGWARTRVEALSFEDLAGYVLKKDSPSCGMERVKVYGGSGMPTRDGRGLFAEALLSRFPNLPVEEEGRLSDPRLRENFIERVFAYRRLKELFRGRWTTGRLVAFHTAHKMALLAHSASSYQPRSVSWWLRRQGCRVRSCCAKYECAVHADARCRRDTSSSCRTCSCTWPVT